MLAEQDAFEAERSARMVKAVYVYEAPLRLWHWVNALAIVVLAVTGYFIGKPLPAFYNRPASIGEMVDHSVSRLLDQFGIHLDVERWSGDMDARRAGEVAKAD